MEAPSSFVFGPFVFHPLSRRLERQGELVPLNSRATELLLLLLRRAGELVTKDDLLSAVWGDRIVAENNLTVHMAALRRALRDGGDAESHIRTEHGRGYRLVTPVEVTQAERDSLSGTPAIRLAGVPDTHRMSVLVPPVQSLLSDETSRSLAVQVGRHLVVQLSRMPDTLVMGMPAGDLEPDAASAASQAVPRGTQARYVLRISVRPKDGEVQIIAMIDDASSGATIWADRFEHRHIGLCPMENEIASRLAHAAITELVDREAALAPAEDTPPTHAAQDSALRGWSALNRELWVPRDLAEARRWFDRALLADPSNASALAGSAYAIVAENIRATAQRRHSLSSVATAADLRQADELMTRAVARAPGWPRAWFCRGYVRLWQRRFDAALVAFERALSLDPCDAESLAYAGHVEFLAGRPDAMEAPVRHAIALSPRDRGVGLWHHWLGQCEFWRGRDEPSVPHFVRATDLAPSLLYPASFLASALAHAGRVAEGRRTLDAWCEAMGGVRLTIDQLRAQVFSDHPVYLAGHERHYHGLRLIGVAER
jgi:DNA-binding winged helix-turn-helix (wHTH) protein/tetratricopeptide (TPR) repeat protein